MKGIEAVLPRSDIDAALSRIRQLSSAGKNLDTQALGPNAVSGFDQVFNLAKTSLHTVNTLENESDALKLAYMKGSQDVSLSQILVSSIKSKAAFEGLLVVRNKLLESYKEIMNMPV